jgi:hypothetical protein
MDHSNVDVSIKQEQKTGGYDEFVVEDGKKYRIPYKMVKKVTFTDLKKEELIDIPHAARLQYRLMLMDPIIKATVDFTKLKISILYNPREADNIREKMSIEEIKEFLSKQGVNVESEHTLLEDYDYYKNLYTYAYTPPSIRERAPYAYTMDEWKKMKPEWEQRQKEGEIAKQVKFKKFQDEYLENVPEMAAKIDPNYKPSADVKVTFMGKIFGKKKAMKKEKGFWFHGM